MTQAEVAVLLALANGHDQRQGIDDVKVQAWYSLLTQEAPEMSMEWARERINWHYARSTEMLMPAHLVSGWKTRKQYTLDPSITSTGPGVPMPEWFRREVGL